jgi:hypothetical protein
LELGFLCVGSLGACFFASPPFSGTSSVIHQLSPCCKSLVMVSWLFFNFAVSFDLDVAHWLRRQVFGPLPALFQAASYHWPTVGPSAFPAFVYWKLAQSCSLLFPRSPVHLQHPAPSAVH